MKLDDIKSAAGSCLMVAVKSWELDSSDQQMLHDINPSGVTLFKRNLSDQYSQIIELTHAIQKSRKSGYPLQWIAIDQEGGRVARLRAPFENLGPAMDLYPGVEPTKLSAIFDYGQRVAVGLRELGINLNFAPVADVLSNPLNTAIGDRCFGVTPESVGLRAGAFLRGMQKAGVSGCLKHFPGQGAASFDTHLSSAEIGADFDLLLKRDLAPFLDLLDHARFVMMSHCIYKELDTLPASLSSKIITGLLKEKFGFTHGLVLSDDMNMGALAQDQDRWQESIIKSIDAGTHLVLVCEGVDKCYLAFEAIIANAEKSDFFAQKLLNLSKEILEFRTKLLC